MEFESVIGLEVHAQLLTNSKAFCSCTTKFGSEPNSNTCPVCEGMPGSLPVLNKTAFEYTVLMAIACNCRINEISRFARKNYYYPDLPKNYQISQYELPVAENGWIDVDTVSGIKRIGITRIHMEEDAGKLIHDERKPISYVDLNRTGVPLIEIVSEPDIRTTEEAAAYLRSLRSILVYLGICDGNMEEGSFRCDANVSIRAKGQVSLGTKTELKNMNSFKNVQKGLQYEIERHTEVLRDGRAIVQETRLFDPSTGSTVSMRSKEQAHDYRYFPDPDLLPLKVESGLIEKMKQALPELPRQKRDRFVKELGIPEYDAGVLTAERPLAQFFEDTVAILSNPKLVSNWIMTEFMRLMKGQDSGLISNPVSPANLAKLLKMIEDGTISGKIGKMIFEEMWVSRKTPDEIVKEKGLIQVSDVSELTEIIQNILSENPKEVSRYLAGKTQLLAFFVGQTMKVTRGKANPQLVNEILTIELEKLTR